jgi:flagellar basal body-associated protein FliL
MSESTKPVEKEATEPTDSLKDQAPDLPADHSEIDSKKLQHPKLKELISSADAPSRVVTILSILFGMLSLISAGLLVVVFLQHKNENNNSHAPEKDPTPALAPIIQEPLGHYQVVLKSNEVDAEGNPKATKNQDLRVDIVAQCDTKETCESLKVQLIKARDLINPILSSATREEMLEPDSKALLRRRIADQLTGLVEPGVVSQIHFSDLTVEPGK